MAVMLLGFSSDQFWKPDGNPTEKHVRLMQESWCEYNEGRDFVTDQCDFLSE